MIDAEYMAAALLLVVLALGVGAVLGAVSWWWDVRR